MKKPPKLPFQSPDEIRAFREKCQMNQTEFWTRVGVTQSAGSRYESGRSIARPVQTMLAIAYGTPAQSAKAVEYLRSWRD